MWSKDEKCFVENDDNNGLIFEMRSCISSKKSYLIKNILKHLGTMMSVMRY